MIMNHAHAKRPARLALVLLAAGSCVAGPVQAADPPTDLRDLTVGMPMSALPAHGYTALSCASSSGQRTPLGQWADSVKCVADDSGRREVSFRYDAEEDTKVAGQPVLLSLVLGPDGTLDAIRMATDPAARLFVRKRGYIFGLQAMARYGEAGWSCIDQPPGANQTAVGGVFVHQHCSKTVGIRHLVVDRELFRRGSDAGRATGPADFTSASRLTIWLASVD